MKELLAIFDLDGTLFATDAVNYEAYKAALEEVGHTVDPEFFSRECNGRHYTSFLPGLLGNDIEKMECVHKRKKELYPRFISKAVPNRHLIHLQKELRKSYFCALVTTASAQNTLQLLNAFGLSERFDLILTQEDIQKPKPDPEGFIKAMEYFHVAPEHTLIFEDSAVGVEAARRSGAAVMIVDRF